MGFFHTLIHFKKCNRMQQRYAAMQANRFKLFIAVFYLSVNGQYNRNDSIKVSRSIICFGIQAFQLFSTSYACMIPWRV